MSFQQKKKKKQRKMRKKCQEMKITLHDGTFYGFRNYLDWINIIINLEWNI